MGAPVPLGGERAPSPEKQAGWQPDRHYNSTGLWERLLLGGLVSHCMVRARRTNPERPQGLLEGVLRRGVAGTEVLAESGGLHSVMPGRRPKRGGLLPGRVDRVTPCLQRRARVGEVRYVPLISPSRNSARRSVACQLGLWPRPPFVAACVTVCCGCIRQ